MTSKRQTRGAIKRSPLRERLARKRSLTGSRGPAAALVIMLITLTALAGAILSMPLAHAAGPPAPAGSHHLKLKHFDVYAKDRATAEKNGRELAAAGKAFEKLLGAPPPRGAVRIQEGAPGAGAGPTLASGSGNGVSWTLPWFDNPFGNSAGGKSSGGLGGNMAASMNPLTHEAAHLMFLHLVNPHATPAAREGFTGYGSYLPDWIDEAVAVFHESEPSKQNRRGQMKSNLRDRIPFETFFSMRHPFMAPGSNGTPGGLQLPGGLKEGGQEMPPLDPNDPKFQKGIVFYAQCLSVLEFFLSRSGEPLVRHLVSCYQQGTDTSSSLKLANTQLFKSKRHKKRRLPANLAQLEALWVEWVKRSY